jgi:hypothetical protein
VITVPGFEAGRLLNQNINIVPILSAQFIYPVFHYVDLIRPGGMDAAVCMLSANGGEVEFR